MPAVSTARLGLTFARVSDAISNHLRVDAQRNRERLLVAAADLFRARGLDVSMEEIAHHAGVGVGTLYRRFGSRDGLIDALFDSQLADLAAIARECAGMTDPWQGLVALLERSLALQTSDRGLKHLVLSYVRDRATLDALRDLVNKTLDQLVERAQAAGTLRKDITPADVMIVSFQAGVIADLTADQHPTAWRRALALGLDGLRASDAAALLPAEPLRFEALDAALKRWQPPLPAP